MEHMPKRAALYLRQSKTDDEGIERQVQRTTALAVARGWQVVETYIDNDVSASKARGPDTAWGRMLAAADGLDVVIGVDLDRVVRSTRDLNTLIDHGLMLVTLDGEIDLTTADGEFRASMLAAIARFEVRRKGERQTRANAQRAAKGGVPKGTRLKGYTTDGQVVDDEAGVVRALFEGFNAGLALRTLARTHDMRSSSVRTILTNARYAGRRVYKGEVVGAGEWEALVPGELFDAVNRRLADPARRTNRTGSTKRKHLGTSLFRCGECDDHPTVRTAGSGGRYTCPVCRMNRTAAPIDDYVLRLAEARLADPAFLAALVPDVDADPLRAERDALADRKATLAGLVADGTMSDDDVREAMAQVKARLAEIDSALAKVAHPVDLVATYQAMLDSFGTLHLDQQRTLIDTLMTVHLLRVPQGKRGFDPDTVQVLWRT